MNITIFGAGAVGGHMAARLAMAGQPVSVIARGAHLAAIKADGLTLLIGDESQVASVNAVADGAELGPQDLVIVALKGNTLPEAADALRPLIGPETYVLFVMNGLPTWFLDGSSLHAPALDALLDPEGAVAAIVAPERTIWGVINSGGTIERPGVVRSTTPKNNAVKVGHPGNTESDMLRQVADLLAKAGYTTQVSTDIRRDIWQKLTVIVGMAMTSAVLGWDNRATIANPETRGVVIGALNEMAAIGRAIGIEIATNFETTMDPAKIAPHRSSFLQDIDAGRARELSTTILASREIGRAAGVPIPYVTTIAALVDARAG